MCDDAHLLRVCDHNRFTCGAITAATEAALPVASTRTISSLASFFAKASRRWRRMSTGLRRGGGLGRRQAQTRDGYLANPMIRMTAPPSLFVRSGSWPGDTTSTDPRSRRIRESRKGRPCNELGLSAFRLPTACPHLSCSRRPRVPDGLTRSPAPFREQLTTWLR